MRLEPAFNLKDAADRNDSIGKSICKSFAKAISDKSPHFWNYNMEIYLTGVVLNYSYFEHKVDSMWWTEKKEPIDDYFIVVPNKRKVFALQKVVLVM